MDLLQIFQNLGFPIAVCVTLFLILNFFIKKSLEMINDYIKAAKEQEQKTQEFLISIIKEQSKVISDNTGAFNNISIVLGKVVSAVEKVLGQK